jgi:hypothetical protein
LKSPDWIDEALELAVVSFEPIIAVFYLQMTDV